jgi:hypothetical protein
MTEHEIPQTMSAPATRRRSLLTWALSAAGLFAVVKPAAAQTQAAGAVRSRFSAADVAAREEITHVLYSYGRAVDFKDPKAGALLFHKNAMVDMGNGSTMTGEQFVQRAATPNTQKPPAPGTASSHQMSNILIELNGDKAKSETYVAAGFRSKSDTGFSNRIVYARYLDDWSFQEGRWAIDRRVIVTDFTQELAPSAAKP